MFRKVGPWYAKRFGPANHFNKRIVHLKNLSEFEDVLSDYVRWRSQFLDEDGSLKPQYQPEALLPTFMEDQPAVARREHIPVPKGPVEVW
jgi:tRNA-dihydrouridine synthase B